MALLEEPYRPDDAPPDEAGLQGHADLRPDNFKVPRPGLLVRMGVTSQGTLTVEAEPYRWSVDEERMGAFGPTTWTLTPTEFHRFDGSAKAVAAGVFRRVRLLRQALGVDGGLRPSRQDGRGAPGLSAEGVVAQHEQLAADARQQLFARVEFLLSQLQLRFELRVQSCLLNLGGRHQGLLLLHRGLRVPCSLEGAQQALDKVKFSRRQDELQALQRQLREAQQGELFEGPWQPERSASRWCRAPADPAALVRAQALSEATGIELSTWACLDGPDLREGDDVVASTLEGPLGLTRAAILMALDPAQAVAPV